MKKLTLLVILCVWVANFVNAQILPTVAPTVTPGDSLGIHIGLNSNIAFSATDQDLSGGGEVRIAFDFEKQFKHGLSVGGFHTALINKETMDSVFTKSDLGIFSYVANWESGLQKFSLGYHGLVVTTRDFPFSTNGSQEPASFGLRKGGSMGTSVHFLNHPDAKVAMGFFFEGRSDRSEKYFPVLGKRLRIETLVSMKLKTKRSMKEFKFAGWYTSTTDFGVLTDLVWKDERLSFVVSRGGLGANGEVTISRRFKTTYEMDIAIDFTDQGRSSLFFGLNQPYNIGDLGSLFRLRVGPNFNKGQFIVFDFGVTVFFDKKYGR